MQSFLSNLTMNTLQSNISPPICRISSEMNFSLLCFSTYSQLSSQYSPCLSSCLSEKFHFLQKLVLIQIQMLPDNMYWLLWKSYEQIHLFLERFQPEIQEMKRVRDFRIDDRGVDMGDQLVILYSKARQLFRQDVFQFNQQLAYTFVCFLNNVGENLYLRKSVDFLFFISHCISVDKWHVMIHQQIYTYNPPSISGKFMGLFKKLSSTQQKQVNKFITITNDGLLLSNNHLLLNHVQKMIPFTNQMQIKCYLQQNVNFVYEISSGRIDKYKIKFYQDYLSGVNFGLGLGRALQYGGYDFLIDTSSRPNYLNLGYQTTKDNSYNNSLQNYPTCNRFQSFAQIRPFSNCKLYNDGCGYYEDLFNELMKAQKQVCMTGWMITPYFLLKRPSNITDPEYRLDGVLRRIASRGVKVFIICYMQPSMFVSNDSQHVQSHLQQIHKNIKVYRHPNVAVPQLWSHHQKMIVIDQKIGFMGGLDVCYGRWDTHEHRLVQSQGVSVDRRFWDGLDFNNYRLKDVSQPRNYAKTNLNKDFQPRMPWHDIAVQIRGDVVIDLLRHFVQYWYFVKSQLTLDPRKLYSIMQKRLMTADSYGQNMQKQYILSQLKQDTQQTFAMKFNAFKQKVSVVLTGEQQRISQLMISQRSGQNAGPLKIQMLRSASEWSIGLDLYKHQSSIHNAYLQLIENAENFIYIENQFFMGLENRIVEVLAEKIIQAKRDKKKFRVLVVMPLLPGFEGDVMNPASTVLRIQVHWQFQAIARSEKSLHNRLFKFGFTRTQIDDYIFFFGLRKAQLLNNIPVTQIVYVHSKLMIVDDKRTIVGSANINDRSMLGDRDSEIAICIQHQSCQQDVLKNESYSLRHRLFEEHFGLSPFQSINILQNQIWNELISQARHNTQIYRNVFGCIPDDNVRKVEDIEQFIEGVKGQWEVVKNSVKGHAVVFPLQFLSGEDLTFKPTQKEFYAPDKSFT